MRGWARASSNQTCAIRSDGIKALAVRNVYSVACRGSVTACTADADQLTKPKSSGHNKVEVMQGGQAQVKVDGNHAHLATHPPPPCWMHDASEDRTANPTGVPPGEAARASSLVGRWVGRWVGLNQRKWSEKEIPIPSGEAGEADPTCRSLPLCCWGELWVSSQNEKRHWTVDGGPLARPCRKSTHPPTQATQATHPTSLARHHTTGQLLVTPPSSSPPSHISSLSSTHTLHPSSPAPPCSQHSVAQPSAHPAPPSP